MPMDPLPGVPRRLPAAIWIAAIVSVLLAYGINFCWIHPLVDTRICLTRLDDPLFGVIPHDDRWSLISVDLYVVITIAVPLLMLLDAVRGEHRVVVRFALALAFQGFMRMVTLLLIPLCRATQTPGTAPLAALPTVAVGPLAIPWRLFATNDLMFSGHVGEAVLILRATRSWPRWARAPVWTFQFAQIYALLATRGHYTADIVVAVPFAFFADAVAVALLRAWGGRAMVRAR